MKMFNLKLGPVLRQYITVIVADFTFLQLGLHIAWLSPLLIKLKDPNQTLLPNIITDEQGAWLISISNLVGLTAFFYNGYLTDRLGRKNSLIIGCIPRLINCVLFLLATDIWMMLFGRAISGISDIFCCSVTSTYSSEIASKEIRGCLGTIAQIMSALGAMLILSVGPFLDYMTLAIIVTCITIVTFIPMLFLPETPYFLYAKGRFEESTKMITLLRSREAIQEELKEYSLNLNMNTNNNKLQMFKDIVVLKTIGKVFVLAVGSQMTGFNAVMFYLQTVLESTHTSIRPEISSVIIGCIQVLACCCTILITDRFGRKPILTTSLVGLTIGMIGLGTFFKLRDQNFEITGFLNYLPLVSLILVIFCFNAGMGATIWTLCAELFDGPSRAMGVSLAVFIATIFTFLTTRYFGSVTLAIGPAATYWMFSACCVVTCLFIALFIPETKCKAFSEIQRDMGRENSAFKGIEDQEESKQP